VPLLVPAGRLPAGRWRAPGRNGDPVQVVGEHAIAASPASRGRRRSR